MQTGKPSNTIDATADREVIVSRVLNVPRELVWEAWTQPKHADKWWGPNEFVTTTESMDFCVGGEWRYWMIAADGTRYRNHSAFKQITPQSKLVYDQGDGERMWFETSVTLQITEGGTLVTLRQLFPSKESRDEVVEKSGASEGGKQHLTNLEAYILENLL
jgi:uncharacterized protein YndB with AHSA1/START domain